jgi:hypothetical protein
MLTLNKEAGVEILLKKTDFWAKTLIRDEEGGFVIIRSVHQRTKQCSWNLVREPQNTWDENGHNCKEKRQTQLQLKMSTLFLLIEQVLGTYKISAINYKAPYLILLEHPNHHKQNACSLEVHLGIYQDDWYSTHESLGSWTSQAYVAPPVNSTKQLSMK